MIKLVRCEFYKLISLKTLIVTFLMPLVLVTIGLMNVYRGIFPITDMTEAIYNQSSILYGGIVFPISMIIIVALQWRKEYKNNNILLLCSSPINLGRIYISKLISTFILVLINTAIYILIILLFSNILLPKGSIPSYFYYSPLLGIIFSLPLISIQHLLSIVTKNFIMPISIGIIMTFAGFILNSSKIGFLVPNIYTFYGLFFNVPETSYGDHNTLLIVVPVISILLITLGTMMFKNKNIFIIS